MYYVIKITHEDGNNNTNVIRPHEDELSATMDFHREIAETLVYPSVQVLAVVLQDDYNKQIESFRYERPHEDPPIANP